jgi:hypothetical protein
MNHARFLRLLRSRKYLILTQSRVVMRYEGPRVPEADLVSCTAQQLTARQSGRPASYAADASSASPGGPASPRDQAGRVVAARVSSDSRCDQAAVVELHHRRGWNSSNQRRPLHRLAIGASPTGAAPTGARRPTAGLRDLGAAQRPGPGVGHQFAFLGVHEARTSAAARPGGDLLVQSGHTVPEHPGPAAPVLHHRLGLTGQDRRDERVSEHRGTPSRALSAASATRIRRFHGQISSVSSVSGRTPRPAGRAGGSAGAERLDHRRPLPPGTSAGPPPAPP